MTSTTMPTESASTTASEDLSAAASLSLADSLFVDDELGEAADAYTAAISVSREGEVAVRIRALSHRSATFLRLQRFAEALADAKEALSLISTMASSQTTLRPGEGEMCHRRCGMAAFHLGRYEDAKEAMQQASQLAKLNGRSIDVFTEWLRKCDDKIHVVKPATTTTAATKAVATDKVAQADSSTPAAATPAASAAQPVAAKPRAAETKKPQMPKYQWWQNDKFLTISILEPNVSAADIGVTFEPKRLVITLQKGNANFTVIAGSLYSEINPEKSKTVIKTEKVLVKLRKVDEKFEWRELVGKEDKRDAVKPANTTKAAAKDGEIPIVKESAKTRPYASHRDWDAIEKTLDKEESDEKPVGDEAMNKLFQTIYKDADENTKRAMIKSYQTSGGTVLSTNWDEVAKKDYEKERTAPKGVEWKSWEGKKLPMQDDD